MSTTLNEVRAALRAEMVEAAPASVRLACALGAGSFLGFALVDPYVAPGPLGPLLATRVTLAVLLGGLAATTWWRRFPEYAVGVGMGTCLAIGLGVVILTAMAGGAANRYHEALLLTIFGFSLLPLPWTWVQASVCYLGLVGAYVALMLATGQTGTPAEWWSTNAVLWATVAIAGSLSRLATRLREREVETRLALQASNHALVDAKQRLEDLDRAKSRFFSNLSHELRTPLTLTLAPIDALLEGEAKVAGPMVEDLRLARRSALRMMRLIDDLLVLSRLESASLPATMGPVDVVGLTAALVEEVTPLARRKRILLRQDDGPKAAWVTGDAALLERVVMNLLANALKFTPESGAIHVGVSVRDDRVRITVRDEGVGIPADQLERVFERFHQVEHTLNRAQGGMGIGLALARELVQLHGGTIRAESAAGRGTTMTVELLATAAPASEPAPVPGDAPGRGIGEWHAQLTRSPDYRLLAIDDATERRILPRPRDGRIRPMVLVIEDNADMIRLLGSLLGAEYEVYTARDGESGLRLAHRRRPDLVITDVMMPGIDGFEVLRSLRSDAETRAVPVLMLTAREGVDDRVQAQKLGADAYLTKPFRRSELRATVERMLRTRSAVTEVAEELQAERFATLVRGMVRAVQPAVRRLATEGVDVSELRALVERLELLAPGAPPTLTRVSVDVAVDRALRALPPSDYRRVETDTPPGVYARASGDDVVRMVTELVDNALQASPVETAVEVAARVDAAGVRIEVRDRGLGVSGGSQDRIFHPFYTTRLETPGAGLGLAVARALARRNGGEVGVEENPGGGTIAIIRLPVWLPDGGGAAVTGAEA